MDKVLKQNNPFGIRWKYDYYTANIPHDFGSAVERAAQALREVANRVLLHCTHAIWTAEAFDDSEIVKVRRKRPYLKD
jgi:hypothetical protein